eukprot:6092755-Pyramimonas_sp.AAC.2
MKLQLSERLSDPEYTEFAKQQRQALEQSREAESKAPKKNVTVINEKSGEQVNVTKEGAFILKKIKPKIEEARQAKIKLEAKLREVFWILSQHGTPCYILRRATGCSTLASSSLVLAPSSLNIAGWPRCWRRSKNSYRRATR